MIGPLLWIVAGLAGEVLKAAFGAYFLPFSRAFAHGWLRLWTRRLPERLRERRVSEIEAHLFDLESAGRADQLRPPEIGTTIFVGTVCGMPGDLKELAANVQVDWFEVVLIVVWLWTRILAFVLLGLARLGRVGAFLARFERLGSPLRKFAELAFGGYILYLLAIERMPADQAMRTALLLPTTILREILGPGLALSYALTTITFVVVLGTLALIGAKMALAPAGQRTAIGRASLGSSGAHSRNNVTSFSGSES